MLINLLCDVRCLTLRDGSVWTTSPFSYSFWERYLTTFKGVNVYARATVVASLPPAAKRVDGKGVIVIAVPMYSSALEFLKNARKIRNLFKVSCGSGDAVLIRAPSHLANLTSKWAIPRGKPFAVEVAGDPYDVFASGVGPPLLRKPLQLWTVRSQQSQCRRASAVSYVTQEYLQRRYPADRAAFQSTYSSIDLEESHFTTEPKRYHSGANRLVTVGSLSQLYKGTDVLIAAVAELVKSGTSVSLTIVGDGRFRGALELQVAAAGLSDCVHFMGEVPSGNGVRDALDQADLFVLPSRTEGLPRAMIEAMARGLPCIGTQVGGIPELLSASQLVPAGNSMALAAKIREVLAHRKAYEDAAADGLRRARNYSREQIAASRFAFYCFLRDATEQWNRGRENVK